MEEENNVKKLDLDLSPPAKVKKSKKIEKAISSTSKNKIEDIADICRSIVGTFSNRSDCLYYFLSSRTRNNKRFCHQFITGLSEFDIVHKSLSYGHMVEFKARWTSNIISKTSDWDIVPLANTYSKTQPKQPFPIKTYGQMLFPDVHKICVYAWGFEMFTYSGIAIHAALPYILDIPMISEISFKENNVGDWQMPMKKGDGSFQSAAWTPEQIWLVSDDEDIKKMKDQMSEIFGEKVDKSLIFNTGTRNVDLDI